MSSESSGRGVTAGRVAVGVLVVLIVVFAVLNSQSVRMHWIVGTTDTPLFVVMLLFSVIGIAIGYVLARRGRR